MKGQGWEEKSGEPYNTPLKVILVANTDWYLYNFRLSLARYLREQGFSVVLASPAGSFSHYLQEAGFTWLEWNVGRQTLSPISEAGSLLRLAALYRRAQADLVHHFTIKPVLYGSLAARLAKVRGVVNSITGLGYIFIRQELKARLLRQMTLPFYRLAFAPPHAAAIFENENDRQFFIHSRLVPAERTWLIEGVGVDADQFTPQPEAEGTPLVVLPGRMLWDKGVGVLVEAARLLHQRTPVRIALVGEPDPGNPANIPEATLQEWSREGVVEWWGWQKDMHAIYSRSHVVTLPSLGEGVPTALLEAAACARPIVTTDTPGCRDVVQDGVNGLVVPPNDPLALAEALERLVRDSDLRQRMGAAGRQLVLEKYTSRRINRANLEIYRTVLGLGEGITWSS